MSLNTSSTLNLSQQNLCGRFWPESWGIGPEKSHTQPSVWFLTWPIIRLLDEINIHLSLRLNVRNPKTTMIKNKNHGKNRGTSLQYDKTLDTRSGRGHRETGRNQDWSTTHRLTYDGSPSDESKRPHRRDSERPIEWSIPHEKLEWTQTNVCLWFRTSSSVVRPRRTN